MIRYTAIVPLKTLASAKTRLSPSLSSDERQTLMIQAARTVLISLQRAAKISKIFVVTREPMFLDLACQQNLGAISVSSGEGLNGDILHALAMIPECEPALIIPGDLPLITAEAIDAFLEHGGEDIWSADVRIMPDQHDIGTNAIALRRPGSFIPCFGPWSAQQHAEQAHLTGNRVLQFAFDPRFADIDTAEDMMRFHKPPTGTYASGRQIDVVKCKPVDLGSSC